MELARKLRQLVTRENYPGFILDLDKMPQTASSLRRVCLELARERRFKGVVFSDVGGSIAFEVYLNRRSRELGLPIFQPLIGLDEMELSKLGHLLGVNWRESKNADVQPSTSQPSIESLDLSTLPITEVSL